VDGQLSKVDREFAAEAREWLHANIPVEARPPLPTEARAYDLAWQRTMYDGGWAGIAWPTEYGGRGSSLLHQMIWHEEYARAGAPFVGVCFVGLNHGGPTIIARGSAAQQAEYLPPILRGEVVWSQGFSEPGAGSDLAALATRGVIDGDQVVVTGQKIWTSYGDVADLQELLVRTDPSAPKHRGISWFVCDMKSPGIEVRPIRTMADSPDFCEVFYDEVRIPMRNLVGGLNDGWSVAKSTLSFERGTAYVSQQIDLARIVENIVDYAKSTTDPSGKRRIIDDDEIARELATVRSEVTAMRALTYLVVTRAQVNGEPGPSGSIVRLFFTQLQQRVYRAAALVLGRNAYRDVTNGTLPFAYLHSYSRTIAGGTKDIQRNIIAERVLGLPRD
jgi:alkylation response protein AidB-like acyl-CoA dehydrogenase